MSFKSKGFIFFIIVVFFSASVAGAVDLEEKRIGIGFAAGYPTGISIKIWTHPAGAIDFTMGWSRAAVNKFTGQINLLRHTFDFFEVTSGKLPYYTGIGTRFLVRDPDNLSQETRIGIRLVGGLDYIFDNLPTELFLEIGPVLDIVPETKMDITAGLGARYYF
jgi:hypothetical protein